MSIFFLSLFLTLVHCESEFLKLGFTAQLKKITTKFLIWTGKALALET